MDQVAVGVIGCGNISGIYLKNLKSFPIVELVACAAALVTMPGPVRRVAGLAKASFPERIIITRPEAYAAPIRVETPTHITGLLDFASAWWGPSLPVSMVSASPTWSRPFGATVLRAPAVLDIIQSLLDSSIKGLNLDLSSGCDGRHPCRWDSSIFELD